MLADARFLLRHKRWHSATYLGGYGLECLLKVAVCAHLNVRELPREYEVHDLAFLLNRAAVEEPLKGNQRIEQRFRRMTAVWSVELRYRGRLVSASEAREFFRDLEEVLEWLRGQISKQK